MNDSTSPFVCGFTFLLFTLTIPTRCQQTALGDWRIFSSWDEFSDGSGVVDPLHDIKFKIKASGVGTLSISSSTVLPFIPAEDSASCPSNPQAMGIAPFNEPAQAGGTTRIRVLVRDPVCSIAVPGVKVSGDLTRQTGTGGHVHSGLLPHLIDAVPVTAGVQITKSPERISFTGTTDTAGVVEIEARAGEAASGVLVNVTIEQPQGTVQTLTGTFAVKQADFSELIPTGSSGFTLAGQTGIHPKNHFGTSALISAIDQLGTVTKQGTRTILLPNGLCLAVDDMSLEHGAVFDLKADGTEPHCTHRRGLDVDIRGFSDCSTGEVKAGVQGKTKVEQFVLRDSGKVLLNKWIKGKQIPLTPANEPTLHYRVSP